jgi:uncharacterized protein (DUF433 family)
MQHAVHGDGAVSEGYVTHVDSGYYVAGTRVSLDSIVYAFFAGQTAEAIAQSLPVLTLEQVYGAVAYYLAHRQEIDEYLAAQRDDFEAKRAAARAADPMFYQKLQAARRSSIAS